jgi:hypothetical protein
MTILIEPPHQDTGVRDRLGSEHLNAQRMVGDLGRTREEDDQRPAQKQARVGNSPDRPKREKDTWPEPIQAKP